jgi:hypothetical protein
LRFGVNKVRAADVAAICVILLAGALSTAWVFIVPIFQANDEAAHFDYAISIANAGHPIPIDDKKADWIVSPYTRYLLSANDYFRIAFHSSMRAPHGYGTLAYYRQLDANAPSLQDPQHPSGRISYLAALYPFGFYTLEGAWMRIIGLLTNSLAAVFFGGRMLCVFLMMLGLYFNYRTAINIGLPRWIGVALVTATAFFPLTTTVSAYIQPDNLAYALVSASLFFATQLRGAKRPVATTAALGLALGFLAVTKYQFFLSAAIPIALLLLARLWSERPAPVAALLRISVLAIPTVVLLRVQTAIAPPGFAKAGGNAPSATLLGPLHEAMRSGAGVAATYVFSSAAGAFRDFYITGPNAATYWGTVGSGDTPLIVGNEHVELALRVIISLVSAIAAVLISLRVSANLFRLLRVALQRGPSQAMLLATSDPILGAYVLFTLILFALYIASDNAFGATGRQWYPYIFAAFMCAGWYAPRTLPRLRRTTPTVAALLAIYALVSSGYATAAVLTRYYGTASGDLHLVARPSQIVPENAVGYLWPIQGMDFHPIFTRRVRSTFATGSRLWAGGAAIFPSWHRAADEVAVIIDGHVAARTVAQQYNFQTAEATRDLTYGYSGFFAPIDTRGLSEGAHLVTAYARVPDSRAFAAIAPRRSFFLLAGTAFSGNFLRALARAPLTEGSLESLHACRGDISEVNGMPVVRTDDVIVANGRLGNHPRTPSESIVWLLVDGRPYPASLAGDGTFSSTISTSDLGARVHDLSAYVAIPSASTYLRIPFRKEFLVSSQRPAFRITPSQSPLTTQCRDALMAATDASGTP